MQELRIKKYFDKETSMMPVSQSNKFSNINLKQRPSAASMIKTMELTMRANAES